MGDSDEDVTFTFKLGENRWPIAISGADLGFTSEDSGHSSDAIVPDKSMLATSARQRWNGGTSSSSSKNIEINLDGEVCRLL